MAKTKSNKQEAALESIEKKLTPKKLPVYQQELERLTRKYNGTITPGLIVKEAENKYSPLNNLFDWDNDSAGPKYRLWQARMLITTLRIKVIYDGETKDVRQYLSVNINNDDDGKAVRAYLPTEVVLTNEKYKEQMLKKAISEAEYWKRSYRDFVELESIFKAINKTQKKLKNVLKY
jgi:hypothetical protein